METDDLVKGVTDPSARAALREDAVVRTMETIERRIDELGVTEPSISRQGTAGNEILVQLPGVTDIVPGADAPG